MPKLFSPYLVKETSTTEGLVDFVLAGAMLGFRAANGVIPDGTSFTYYIKNVDVDEWEVGEGSYTVGTNTVVRTTVRASTNSDAKVNFSAGTKEVSIVEDNYAANFIASPAYLASDTPANLPEAIEQAVLAAGREANAASFNSVALGRKSAVTTASDDGYALGNGAVVDDASDSYAIGSQASCQSPGSLWARDTMSFGTKATAYNRGMHSFGAGGYVSNDFTRLFKSTSDATPTDLDLDASGSVSGERFDPILDGRPKTIALEVHVIGHNSTDNDGWYHKYNLLGHYNGTNFIQVGTTTDTNIAEGAAMTGVAVVVSISANQLQVNVTGIAAKTIQWAANIVSTALWHSQVPGSGVA